MKGPDSMWTGQQRVLLSISCVALGAIGPSCGSCGRAEGQLSVGVAAHRALCNAVYGFTQGADPDLTPEDCGNEGCGLNGSWLGRGVRFRTLWLNGNPNKQNLRIDRVRDGAQELKLHVDGQDVFVTKPGDNARLSDEVLRRAEIVLSHRTDQQVTEYILTLKNIHQVPFWADTTTGAPEMARTYDFTVHSSQDGCDVPVCKPGKDDDYEGGMEGTAVIFRGDTYDDTTYAVTTPASEEFNIACIDTSVAKLHLLRHSTASATAQIPTTPQRQTLLRLLTADYCGNGHSFTVDGLPIKLGYNNAAIPLKSTSRYNMSEATGIEARWGASGATCITQPRLGQDIFANIQAVCGAAAPPTPCPPGDIADPGAGYVSGLAPPAP